MATVYIDGVYYSKEEAKISVYDHGLLYGDGIFEGISIYNGRIFKLKEHLLRLWDSAKALNLAIPLSLEDMGAAVVETVSRENLTRGYVRLVVTRGVGTLGLDPDKCEKSSVIIIADTIRLYPEEYYSNGIAVITAATRRIGPAQWDPRVKSLNYLNNILAKMEARQAGCLEAVMLNEQGYVVECTADNLFLVKDGELHTPAAYLGLLEGITRNTLMGLAEHKGLVVKEGCYSRYDLYTSEELFMTGSGAELVPIISVDQRAIGTGQPGPVFKELREDFVALVHS